MTVISNHIKPIVSSSCFKRIKQDGLVIMTKGVGLQVLPTPLEYLEPNTCRVGFIVTKRLGGAVVRNRVKRRLRAAASNILPMSALAGYDYILIGRLDTEKRNYKQLLQDLLYALKKTKTGSD